MKLTVTTWNLQGSKGVDPEVVARHCRERRTDVLLLQEVQRRQAREIAGALGARSSKWSLKHWPVRIRAEGMAVYGLTLPVHEVRVRAVTRRWFVWSWRRRLIQMGRVEGATIVNLHLTPHGPTSEVDRAREIAWLLERLRDRGPVVVGGDFNADPGDGLLDELQAAGLGDAWLACHPDDPDGGRTNWSGRRNRPPLRRIDYLWVSAGVTVEEVDVPAYAEAESFAPYPALSDHLPFTATLALPEG